ncbi:lactonase family protein [Agrobacterium rhizogenes]|jgi:6-phosphogluconolactonase (cycloisomerase 2 family)|uniref:Lactonase family protein n=2 Tax=unclassified Rhizobium TaxID=2613769 RepID=A0AAU7SPG1_9HYPH|nr:lactonase family protein [Rhizobium rhizogenes]NTJ78289.1 lactonase family protein [Rhizobium rhizogenes]
MTLFAYVGCRTTRERNARGEGISVYEVNEHTAEWSRIQVLATEENPSFLALHPALDLLYSVHGDFDLATSYGISPDGRISPLGKQSTKGRNPVHLAIDPGRRWLVVPNYKTDSLVSLPIAANGKLLPAADLCELTGELGPHKVEQNYGRPHHAPFSPSGKWIAVPEKGNDQITIARIEAATGGIEIVHRVPSRENSGPRHIVFHPRLPTAYVLNELDSTITTYDFDDGVGSLSPRDIISSLPRWFTGNNRASEIEITSDERFLYASNRGHDSIAVFGVDETGEINHLDWTPSQGRTPRFFTMDPLQKHLYVANEDSDTIVRFKRTHDGRLISTGDVVKVGSPTTIVFHASRFAP